MAIGTMKTTTIHQRMSSLIEALGMNAFQFAQALGVTSTQIYNCVNGRNAPSFDLLSKIAITFPTVNLPWLLTGKGAILVSGPEEIKEGINVMEKIKILEDRINELTKQRTSKITPEEALSVLSGAIGKKKG